MASGGCLAIDRTAEIEAADDSLGSQREHLAHEAGDALIGDKPRAVRIDPHTDRVGHADRVGQLHFAFFGESRGDDVLGDMPGHISGRTIDLGRVLAAERATAMPAPAAVTIDDDFAPGQPRIAVRAADHESARRVDVVFRLR